MRHKVTHSITQIAPKDNRVTHQVSIRIPMENRWIDNVRFHIWKENEKQEFEMHYDGKDETYAYFKTEEDLSNCKLSYYFFTYEADSQMMYDRHIQNLSGWRNEDNEIFKFYQEVVEFCKSGDLFKTKFKILQISWEHLIFERSFGEDEVIIIANRSKYKIEIVIPRAYDNAQVIFCTEGSNCEILHPYGAIVLKK